MNSRRQNFLLTTILLIVIGSLRLSLLGHGALSGWDEVRYSILAKSLGLLNESFQLRNFVEGVTAGTLGRPGVILFWGPALFVQYFLTPSIGVDLLHPSSLYFAQLFSWLYSMVALFLFSWISYLLFKEKIWWAFLSVLCFSLLTNSTFYVRMINPFDPSLCCFLLAIVLVLRSLTLRTPLLIVTGLMMGIGFLTYPGNFWLGVILLAIAAHKQEGRNIRFTLGMILCGGLITLALTEIISSAFGHSYSTVLNFLIPTVSRGDSSETLLFPLKYLIQVEGVAGLALLISLLLVLIRLPSWYHDKTNLHSRIILWTLFCMIVHGILGTLFGAPVFYGRLLHQFFPFLCLAIGCAGILITSSRLTKVYSTLILSAFIAHAVSMFTQLNEVIYPRDEFYNLIAQDPRWEFSTRYHESSGCSPVTKTPSFAALTFPKVEERYSDLTLVNFCDFYEISEEYHPLNLPDNVVAKEYGPHFKNFIAYAFEGHDPIERERIRDRNYQVLSYYGANSDKQ